MNKYTLGAKIKNKPGLYNLLNNGKKTGAIASKLAVIHVDCVIHGGEFHGGWFHGGVFHGGEFHGGEFHGGWFYGGEFHGGEFHGGWFYGGVFHGGEFHGGEFHGGEFHGGVFHGGVFYGGWLSLQIQGSKHFLNIPQPNMIKIGCIKLHYKKWLKAGVKIGKAHGYTASQAAEYKRYVDLAVELIVCSNAEDKTDD